MIHVHVLSSEIMAKLVQYFFLCPCSCRSSGCKVIRNTDTVLVGIMIVAFMYFGRCGVVDLWLICRSLENTENAQEGWNPKSMTKFKWHARSPRKRIRKSPSFCEPRLENSVQARF